MIKQLPNYKVSKTAVDCILISLDVILVSK